MNQHIEDIESIVSIPDYSIYILSLIIFVTTLVLFVIGKSIFRKRQQSEFEKYLQLYQEIDLNDSKKAAYLITKYSNILAKDHKSKEIKERLDENLKEYKYKKEVKEFSDETKNLYHLFLEVVSHE